MRDISELANTFSGKSGALVGSGPSILNLRKEHLEGVDVVLSLNYAVLRIREIRPFLPFVHFAMCKDARDYKPDEKSPIRKSPVICTTICDYSCRESRFTPQEPEILLLSYHESSYCSPEYSNKYIFNNNSFGFPWYEPSAMPALKIMSLLGIKSLRLISFDAVTTGSISACYDNKNINTTISGNSFGDSVGYIRSGIIMKQTIPTCGFDKVDWVTPV